MKSSTAFRVERKGVGWPKEEPSGAASAEGPGEVLVLYDAEDIVGTSVLRWKEWPRAGGRFRIVSAELGPIRLSRGFQDTPLRYRASAVRALLREINYGDRPWHVVTLRLTADQQALVGAAAAYASIQRLPVRVTFGPEPGWGPELDPPEVPCEIRVQIYESSLKGRLAHFLGFPGQRMPTFRRRASHVDSGAELTLIRDLSAPPLPVDRAPSGVTVRVATEPEMYPRPLSYSENLHVLERSLRSGDRCVVGEEPPGQVVSYLWATDNAEFIEELYPDLGGACLHLYEAFTVPERRGERILGELVRWVEDGARDDAIRYLVAKVDVANQSARRAFQRCGFEVLEARGRKAFSAAS